jgi:hypothetical protein
VSYTTTFSGTENPLSESGVWTNGAAVGVDWTNLQKGATAGAKNGAFGTQTPGTAPPFNDSVAILSGFSRDQSVQCTIAASGAANDIELEMHLRSQITPHLIRGYEIDLYVPTGKLSLVRWNGPLNDFTILVDNITTNVSLADAAVWFAQVVGNTVTVKCNSVTVLTHDLSTDTYAWTRGSPGVGAYRDNSQGTPSAANTFAWDDFTGTPLASDNWGFVSAASSKTKTVSLAVTAGMFLAVGFLCGDGTSTPTISDGVNTWTAVAASPVKDTTNGNSVSMWSAVAATTATITVTITAAATTFNGTWIQQWSGSASSSLNAGSAGTANIAGSVALNGISTGSFTPSVNGCLILTFIVDAGNTDTTRHFNAGTSPIVWNKEDTSSQDPAGATDGTYAVADFVQGTAAAINPTWTELVSSASLAISAAFKPAPVVTSVFRKTLSGIGGRVGSRQLQA